MALEPKPLGHHVWAWSGPLGSDLQPQLSNPQEERLYSKGGQRRQTGWPRKIREHCTAWSLTG